MSVFTVFFSHSIVSHPAQAIYSFTSSHTCLFH